MQDQPDHEDHFLCAIEERTTNFELIFMPYKVGQGISPLHIKILLANL
jgi:hypothetical protein